VLDYVKNPFDFLQKIKKIFGDNTIIYIEGPRFDYTLEQQLFFDICYEQVNYFTEKSMQILFPKAIKNGRCFGQEYQFTMAYLRDLDDRFRVNYESNSWEPVPFESIFPEIINKIKKIEMKALSKSNIYIWGAARKGCMFSWHCYSNGILFDKIKNAVDINSYRHNRFFPGSNLKIISPDDLRRNLSGNDMVLVMNSIYREEIELMISGWGYPDVEIYPV
jgi:hypothetical protein